MIAWILDDSNDKTPLASASPTSRFFTFPQKDRSELLCNLFNVTPLKSFSSIKTHVEWNDIDIMIETKDTSGNPEIWVIENKLKSQEHLSNVKTNGQVTQIWQTVKYENIISMNFPNFKHHYLLLSLGRDKAKSTSGKWVSATYDDLKKTLQNINNLNSYDLVEEYYCSIQEMTYELHKFLNSQNYSVYSHVFMKLKNANKSRASLSQAERYIVENNLETIFQKQFLAKLTQKLQIQASVEYDERNGIAMFIVNKVDINNTDFYLQIEFQGGTFKVVLIHKDYNNANSYIHTTRIYGNKVGITWNGTVYNFFIDILNTSFIITQNATNEKPQNLDWKIHCSKNLGKQNAKPRIAIDKSLGKKWYHNQNFNTIQNVYNEAIQIHYQLLQYFRTNPSLP